MFKAQMATEVEEQPMRDANKFIAFFFVLFMVRMVHVCFLAHMGVVALSVLGRVRQVSSRGWHEGMQKKGKSKDEAPNAGA